MVAQIGASTRQVALRTSRIAFRDSQTSPTELQTTAHPSCASNFFMMIFDKRAYKHPRIVDALDNNFQAIHKLLKDIGMPEKYLHGPVRAMKLRYRLAHAELLEECERAYGSAAIDEQAERYKDATPDVLRDLCHVRDQPTHGDRYDLLWRIHRYELGIEKIEGEGYRMISAGREASSMKPIPKTEAAFDSSFSDYDHLQHSKMAPATTQSRRPEHKARGFSPDSYSSNNRDSRRKSAVATSTTTGIGSTQTNRGATSQSQPAPSHQPEPAAFVGLGARHVIFEPVKALVNCLAACIWLLLNCAWMLIELAWATIKGLYRWIFGESLLLQHFWGLITHQTTKQALRLLWQHRNTIVALAGLAVPALKVLANKWPWIEKIYNLIMLVLKCVWRCAIWFTKHPYIWTSLTSWWPALHQFGFDWWTELSSMACKVLRCAVGCPECKHPRSYCKLVEENAGSAAEGIILETVVEIAAASISATMASLLPSFVGAETVGTSSSDTAAAQQT